MSYLADTQVLLWVAEGSERLSARMRALIRAPDAPLFYSVASLWEMAIKVQLGKLQIEGSVAEFAAGLRKRGWQFLPVRIEHAGRVAELPLHHRDPFDRMLIAQAIEEEMRVITSDRAFDAYDIEAVR